MAGIVLLIAFVVGVPILLAIWLIVRAIDAQKKLEELASRLALLERKLHDFRQQSAPRMAEETAPISAPKQRPEPAPVPAKPVPVPPPLVAEPAVLPSAIPTLPTPAPPVEVVSPAAPPPIPKPSQPAPAPLIPKLAPMPQFLSPNWEQFMGVKMFAWIGGLALFLGVVFFVKYSFERNWISPEVRVSLGFLTGAGLILGGTWMSRKEYPTLSQTLCATG